MPKYFMSGTKYAAFERMMMEVPRPQRHPEQRQRPSPREKKGLPLPKNEQTEAPSERSD
jgi:hypothetical protein